MEKQNEMFIDVNTAKSHPPIFRLILAITLLGASVGLFFMSTTVLKGIIIPLLSIAFMLYAIYFYISLLFKGHVYEAMIGMVIFSALSVCIFYFRDFFVESANIILAAIAILIAILRITIIIHLATVKGPGIIRNIISVVGLIFFAFLMFVFDVDTGAAVVQLVLCVYCLLFAISFLGDFFAYVFKTDLKADKKNRRTHYSLPNVITAYTSTGIIKKYDKLLKEHPHIKEQVTIKEGTEEYEVNFSVLIHVSKILAKRMGHVDIALGDKVYTYGCYDSSTNKLGGMISKGTFCILPKRPYLNNCLIQQKKYVVEYGCHLSEQQLEAVHNRIKEIFSTTTKKDLSYDSSQDKEGNDGANTVAKLGGEMYYVNEGPFKTYYAISSNCVQLADTIVGTAGFDIMSYNSLRTPGAYYKMMENMFTRPGSRVIKKTAYLQPQEENNN